MFGNIADQFLQATGHEKKLPLILMGAASTNVLINALLIPHYASMGAAFATFLSECILATLSLRILAQIGYSQASKNIGFIAIISLVVTAIPSLLLYGLTPIIGIGLIIPCIAILLFRMRYKNFLEPVPSEQL
jgi:O-antigen/teichoic acid export membrane protein